MGGTNGVNGSGNNYFKLSWSKPSLKAAHTELPKSTQIQLTSTNSVQREELGFINPYGSADPTISETGKIALATNDIMAKLGYPNYKVSPKTVASVTDGLNNQTLPSLNTADDNAVAARVATPKGPFAELFT